MYKVDIVNEGGFKFKANSKGYDLLISPKGDGISPPDVLLASLGSCIGVYIRKYAEGAKIDIPGFDISIEAEFSKERPVCFREINVSIILKNTDIDDRRKEALIGFIKNCPVHNTLKADPVVNIKI
ncbi:OsmC family protein [Candidatus Omnitrophota bacterium]